MIDLSTIQLVSAVPEQMLALEAANSLLLSEKQALVSSNNTLKKLSVTLALILVGVGVYQLVKYFNKKDEEIENKMPALKREDPLKK